MSGTALPPDLPRQLEPVDFYLGLVTSYHSARPRFMATVRSLIAPGQALAGFLDSLTTAFDLDTAVGLQLDQVGQWVGRSRNVLTPLSGVYFSWSAAGVGWNQGNWKGLFDAGSGLSVLDDGNYRLLLRAKIAANSWSGGNGTLPAILAIMFPSDGSTHVVVLDNNNLTMSVGISGLVPSQVQLALLDGGYVPIKPDGVAINYYVTSIDGRPLFSWGVSNTPLAGWARGAWGLAPSNIDQVLFPVTTLGFGGADPGVEATITVNATVVHTQPQSFTALQGIGTVSAVASGPLRSSATLRASGGLTVQTLTVSGARFATLAGAGRLIADSSVRGHFATASIAGQANIVMNVSANTWPASARIAGLGQALFTPPAQATTWNPSDLSGMTLSNNSLTATTSLTTLGGVRSTNPKASGLLYAEFKLTSAASSDRVGLANALWTETQLPGNNLNSVGLGNTGVVSINSAAIGSAATSWTAGGVLGVAVNIGTKKIWFTLDGSNWDASGSGDNPATGAGGYSLATLAAGPYYLAFGGMSGTGSGGPNTLTGNADNGTNLLNNPALTGGVNGTTTIPSDWFTALDANLTSTQVSQGTTNGVPFVDINISGTPSGAGSSQIFFDTLTIPGAVGCTLAFKYALVGGSMANVDNFAQIWGENDSGGVFINIQGANIANPTSTLVEYVTSAVNDSNTDGVTPGIEIDYSNGGAINVTVRISGILFGSPTQPVLVGPTAASIGASTTLAITGITLADSNQPLAGNCQLNITCGAGNTLTVTQVTGGSVTGNNSAAVAVADTFANCQTVIKSLIYNAGSAIGSNTLKVTLVNQQSNSSFINIAITIVASSGGAAAKTLNVGNQTFAYTVPSGFLPWDSYPPGPPSPFSAIAGPTTMQLNWGAPAVGTAPLTYTVQYRLAGSSIWTTAVSGISVLTYTVTGLTNSTSYDFQVLAVNALGNATAPFITASTTAAVATTLTGITLSGTSWIT